MFFGDFFLDFLQNIEFFKSVILKNSDNTDNSLQLMEEFIKYSNQMLTEKGKKENKITKR